MLIEALLGLKIDPTIIFSLLLTLSSMKIVSITLSTNTEISGKCLNLIEFLMKIPTPPPCVLELLDLKISLSYIGSINLCVLCVFVVRSTPSLGGMYLRIHFTHQIQESLNTDLETTGSLILNLSALQLT